MKFIVALVLAFALLYTVTSRWIWGMSHYVATVAGIGLSFAFCVALVLSVLVAIWVTD